MDDNPQDRLRSDTSSPRINAPASKTELRDSRMTLPTNLDYPIIAIADLHGQLEQLKRLVTRLEQIAEWDDCALVFLGDFVDRGEDIPATIDMVLELLSRRPGGSAVLGNHDLALVRAARLDDGPPSPYWIEHYLHSYDHEQTFLGYLRRTPNHDGCQWERDLEELKRVIPAAHRAFLVSLPWVVESPGHLFSALRSVVRAKGKCDRAACGAPSQAMEPFGHEAALGLRNRSEMAARVPRVDRCPQRPIGATPSISGQGSGHRSRPGLGSRRESRPNSSGHQRRGWISHGLPAAFGGRRARVHLKQALSTTVFTNLYGLLSGIRPDRITRIHLSEEIVPFVVIDRMEISFCLPP